MTNDSVKYSRLFRALFSISASIEKQRHGTELSPLRKSRGPAGATLYPRAPRRSLETTQAFRKQSSMGRAPFPSFAARTRDGLELGPSSRRPSRRGWCYRGAWGVPHRGAKTAEITRGVLLVHVRTGPGFRVARSNESVHSFVDVLIRCI